MKKVNVLAMALLSIVFYCCNDDSGTNLDVAFDGEILSGAEVLLNPNEDTPLAARVVVETATATSVEITVEGNIPVTVKSAGVGSLHEMAVVGLYPGITNNLTVTATSQNGEVETGTLEITTDTIPDYMPDIEILTIDPSVREPGMYLAELYTTDGERFNVRTIIFDADGEIRWYYLGPNGSPFTEQLRNGNLITGASNFFYEFNLLGEVIREYSREGFWLHHDIHEKENGNFIIPVNVPGLSTIEDHAIEIDRNSGELIKTWDFRESLDENRQVVFFDRSDWLHVNSVWYEEDKEQLIVSARHQGVFAVDNDNNLRWIIAPHRGWTVNESGVDNREFLTTALDADGSPFADGVQEGSSSIPEFDWVWAQHAASRTTDGDILIFDNGLRRNFQDVNTSRAVEYELDEENLTVKETWAYGEDRGGEFFSGALCNVTELAGGNRLLCSGWANKGANIVEVTAPDSRVAFDARLTFKNAFSVASGWEKEDVVYRAHKITLNQ